MQVAIIGAGAVGLAVGSCLLEAGERVCFVARGGAAADLRRRGLRRTGIFGVAVAGPEAFEVVESVGALAGHALDLVLVCTKTTASREVAGALAAVWGELPGSPRVVVVHNGWGSAEIFAEHLPRERVYSARVITGFRRTGPATSDITVHAEPVQLGSLFDGDLRAMGPLAEALGRGGLPCEVSADIARDLWSKVIYNCALNPLGALYGVPYGVLAEDAVTRSILETVVDETFRVIAAAGYETHWSSAADYLRDFYAHILPPTASHESSMLLDLRAGRRTEIDAQCGAVAALGARHGVAAPINAALTELIRAAEKR